MSDDADIDRTIAQARRWAKETTMPEARAAFTAVADAMSAADRVKWCFPLLPIITDSGQRLAWKWISYKTTITREWCGSGTERGREGYTEYWERSGRYLGKITF